MSSDEPRRDLDLPPPGAGYSESPEDEATAQARQEHYRQILQIHLDYAREVTQQKQEDRAARKPFLIAVSGVAGLQLLTANVVFVIYAVAGVDWDIPAAAISAWLGATMAQVIAVLLVLANNLFPKRENERVPDALVGAAGQEPPVMPSAPVLPAPVVAPALPTFPATGTSDAAVGEKQAGPPPVEGSGAPS